MESPVKSQTQPDIARLLADAVARIAQDDHAGAQKLLLAVLAQMPGHAVAIYLLGMIALEQADWAQAEKLFRQALAIAPDQPQISLHLAKALRAQNRGGEAEASLRAALAGPVPDAAMRAALEHQLALILKLAQRHEAALSLMQAAAQRAPASREQMLEQASVLRLLGRTQEAAGLYDQMLAAEPLALDVHILLSEMRGAARPDFVASLDTAMARVPQRVELPVTKGHMLLKARRPQEAQDAFAQALRLAPGNAAALMGLGRALEALQDEAGARDAFARAAATPENSAVLDAYAGFLLRHGDAKEAQLLAERAHRLRPEDQSVLATLDLCWRARGDGRAEWLNDYERHVQIFDLPPPDGYADMESFNRDLGAHLGALHDKAQQYLTQTLRGGTQTHDEIFYNGHALVDRLLPRINQAIKTYAMGWQAGADHPFAARRAGGFRHAGSWSSRLSDCGFHVNHFHHQGWISSCYYVAVPQMAAQEGWIKFGEPADEFRGAGDFAAQRMIQPKPGRLVLFPSYMWHGTMPFHSHQPRLTIAFDAVPG